MTKKEVKVMDEMESKIEKAVAEKYEIIRQQGKILSGIEDVYRQVRYEHPDLAVYIKKRMLLMAKENGDLP